jgi:hypothetical protein
MPPGDTHLEIVSLKFDGYGYITTDDDGMLPEKYPVLLGLSRRLTIYERADLIDDPSTGLLGTSDLMWLGIRDTTVDKVRVALPSLQQRLAEAETRSGVLQEALEVTSEVLAVAQRAELERRQTVLQEINQSLRAAHQQPEP